MQRPWLAHYQDGVPATSRVPEIPVDGLLRLTAERTPDRTALIFFGARTSFGQLDAAASRFAHVLRALGVQRGDRVSLHLPTSPAFVIAFMGIARAGAVAVPANPLYVERELAILFADVRPAVSVTMDLLVPRLRAVAAGGEAVPGRLVVTGIADSLPVPLRWLYPLRARREGRWNPQPHTPETPNLFRLLRAAPGRAFASSAKPDEVAVLQPTGGTTGTPKAAMLTHRNLVANAVQVADWNPGATADGEGSVLCALPFFHIYGLTVDMNFGMLTGATLILLPRFDPAEVLSAIARYRPRLFPGAPIMYQTLAAHPDARRHDLRSIDACISGAAPLAPEVQNAFEEVTGGRVVEGYGLTEASPVTHCNPVHGERRNGTIGLPFPSTDARVVHPASGEPLEVGEVGELEVRGPQVMAGYWERPDETAAALHEGWLRTGDMATMSPDGYFTIVDRRKDIVIVGGINVYPREVEEVLLAHPAVREAAVIGEPEERHGEVVHAYVVLEPGASATEAELRKHCRTNLSRYKVPAAIEIRDELPKTMIGKVLRKDLRAELLAEREADRREGQRGLRGRGSSGRGGRSAAAAHRPGRGPPRFPAQVIGAPVTCRRPMTTKAKEVPESAASFALTVACRPFGERGAAPSRLPSLDDRHDREPRRSERRHPAIPVDFAPLRSSMGCNRSPDRPRFTQPHARGDPRWQPRSFTSRSSARTAARCRSSTRTSSTGSSTRTILAATGCSATATSPPASDPARTVAPGT